MLRTNLSTRPFYNERVIHLIIGAAALLVLLLTIFNVREAITLSARNTELQVRADQQADRASQLDRQAAQIRQSLNPEELKTVAEASREANAIIDQRTFSWTELFNRIESTLPSEVMVTSVRPDVEDEVISVTIVVLARRIEEVDAFVEKLEATGTFEGLLSSQVEATENDMYRAELVGRYLEQGVPVKQPEATGGTGSR